MTRPVLQPLVSCLCVTEDRPAFLPWLLWCFERQTWPAKELVIVDSSTVPATVEGRPNVRVVRAAHRATVASKRNQALAEARGDIIVWFDDDDWQHPFRVECSVALLSGGALFCGPRAAWIVDLLRDRAWIYPGFESRVLFNGAAFGAEIARSVPFDTRRRRASDTVWLTELLRRHPRPRWERMPLASFFWLYHGDNLSISPRRSTLRQLLRLARLIDLRDALGADAWGDTDAQLSRLRSDLELRPPAAQLGST